MKRPTTRCARILGAAALIFALSVPALATSALITRTINAQFGVNLTINDLPFTPTDANGNEVEAMVVNGTTYLPVRALGEATGTTVKWDGTTNTVRLYTSGNGEWIPVDRTFINMMDAKSTWGNPALHYSNFKYTTALDVLKENSNQDYQTGFIYIPKYAGTLSQAEIEIQTAKQYNTIQFQVAVMHNDTNSEPVIVVIRDGNTGTIYGEQKIIAENQIVEADISGAEKIEVAFDAEWNTREETRQVTIGDMKLRG